MNGKSKTLIAVFAVAIMMCGSLVPLACSNENAVAAEWTDDGAGEFSLMDLIEKLKNDVSELKEIDLGNGTVLVPTEDEATNVDPLSATIEGVVPIKENETKTFAEGTTTFKKDANNVDGCVEIMSGGTLVLFPLDGTNHNYVLDSENYNGLEKMSTVIKAHIGAKLMIFDKTFRVASTTAETVDILQMALSTTTYTEFSSICELKLVKSANNTYAVTLDLKKYTEIKILDGMVLIDNTMFKKEVKEEGEITLEADHADITYSGTIVKEDKSLTFSGKLLVDARTYGCLIQGHAVINKIELVHDLTEKGTIKAHASAEISKIYLSLDKVLMDAKTAELTSKPFVLVYNGSISTGEIALTYSGSSSSVEITHTLTVTRESELKLHVDAILHWLYDDYEELQSTFFVQGFDIVLAKTSLNATVVVKTGVGIETSMSLSTGIRVTAAAIGTMVTQDGENANVALMKNLVIDIPSISWTATDYENGKVTTGDITVSALLMKNLTFSNYAFTFAIKITGLEFDIVDAEVTGKGNASIELKTKRDGSERHFLIEATDITIEFGDDGSLKISKLTAENQISLDIFDSEDISEIGAMIGIGGAEGSFEIYNLVYKDGKMTADSSCLTLKNGIGFTELTLRREGGVTFGFETGIGLSFSLTAECGSTYGAIQRNDGQTNTFSIENGSKTAITFSLSYWDKIYIDSQFEILGGDAKFDGGKYPLGFYIGKDAKFTAYGVTAPFFLFEDGCEMSGSVVIDTDAYPLRNQKNVFGTDDYFIYATTGGYKLVFDLSDPLNGTIEANKGNILPSSWSNKSGFSMTSNGEKGTFSIDAELMLIAVNMECDKKVYTLGFANGFKASERHSFGEMLVMPEGPEREGYTFIGWSDGSGLVLEPGDPFAMPARDVTLLPIYAEVVTATVGKDKVATASTDGANIIVADVKNGNWDRLDIEVKGNRISMDKDTFNRLTGSTTGTGRLVLKSVATNNIDDDAIAEAVGERQAYTMRLLAWDEATGTYSDPVYSSDTEFTVTLNVRANGPVTGFNAYYVNENGSRASVGVSGYTDNGDGTYAVTFKVNHFSLYAVEPVYSETDNTVMYAVIGIIIAIIAVCGIAMTFYAVGKKKA